MRYVSPDAFARSCSARALCTAWRRAESRQSRRTIRLQRVHQVFRRPEYTLIIVVREHRSRATSGSRVVSTQMLTSYPALATGTNCSSHWTGAKPSRCWEMPVPGLSTCLTSRAVHDTQLHFGRPDDILVTPSTPLKSVGQGPTHTPRRSSCTSVSQSC